MNNNNNNIISPGSIYEHLGHYKGSFFYTCEGGDNSAIEEREKRKRTVALKQNFGWIKDREMETNTVQELEKIMR